MYIRDISNKEYKTLDFVKAKKSNELPQLNSATSTQIFKDLGFDAPSISLQNRQFDTLDRAGIQKLIKGKQHETMHKVLSILAIAAVVTAVVAAVALAGVFCAPLAAGTPTLGFFAIYGTCLYAGYAFNISKNLQKEINKVESMQKDVDALVEFMDAHGNEVLETLEDQLLEMKPSTTEELYKKEEMERTALQLRLAAKFVAEYVQQMEKD
ncbi:MAG: hypothetical protein ACK5MA_09550 [Parachlamydiaceae bacterium]